MIGRLRGAVVELAGNVALIDVGGVGYEVEVTTGTAAGLGGHTGEAVVFTHLVGREDGQALYGFASASERDLFRTLIKVAGVGPKLALALLSTVSPEQFAASIANGDAAAITRVPGIGKKTAERLVVELRDRVALSATTAPAGQGAASDAVLALVALGYRESAALRAIGDVGQALGDGADVEALVKEALKRMAAA